MSESSAMLPDSNAIKHSLLRYNSFSHSSNERSEKKITRHSAFFDALLPNILLRRQDNNGGCKDDQHHHHPTLDDFKSKVDFYYVFLFLAVYIGLGGLCIFLVRHQIKGKKTIAIFDSIYFCVVTMTTLGYGDLVPDSGLTKLLSCVLVFAGMALIGFTLSKAADAMLERQEILLVKAMHIQNKPNQREVQVHRNEYKFFISLGILLVLMILGVIFLNQIEGLNLTDSFYCVCATVTSLGYGDKSFSTKLGRIFASLWILISTLCLAQTFYYLVDLYTDKRRKSLIKRVITRKFTMADLEAADLDHDKVVSAAEFIVYKLKEMEKISDDDIAMIMEYFKQLDVDQSGTLTEADLILGRSPKLYT